MLESGLLRINLELHKPVGEDETPQAPRSIAVGSRIEAPKGVWGGGVPSPLTESPLPEKL